MIVVHKPIPGLKPPQTFKIVNNQLASKKPIENINQAEGGAEPSKGNQVKNNIDRTSNTEFHVKTAQIETKTDPSKAQTIDKSPVLNLVHKGSTFEDQSPKISLKKEDQKKRHNGLETSYRSNQKSEDSDPSLDQKYYKPTIPVNSNLV